LQVPAARELVDIVVRRVSCGPSITAASVGFDQSGAHVFAQAARNAKGQRFAECRGSSVRLAQGIHLQPAQGKSGEWGLRIVSEIREDALKRTDCIGRVARQPSHVGKGEEIAYPEAC
jgi:hypothetical protein